MPLKTSAMLVRRCGMLHLCYCSFALFPSRYHDSSITLSAGSQAYDSYHRRNAAYNERVRQEDWRGSIHWAAEVS